MRAVRALVSCALLVGCLPGTNPPPAPPRQASLELPFASFTLANGLRVVVVTEPSATDVHVTMRYQVGSVDDPPDHAGMAHLVEHLMFDLRDGDQPIYERLQSTASMFNAMTTLDATTYVARARVDRLDVLLAIEAARIDTPCASLAPSEFARERDVVVNEMRQRERSVDVMSTILEATYPDGHPYHRSSIGTEHSVGSITREEACAFADSHYAPGNAVLVVSGNLTRPQLEAALAKRLAHVPTRRFVPATNVVAPAFAPKEVELRARVDEDELVIAWPLPHDPKLRAKYQALLATAAGEIANEADANVWSLELGDARAPMFAIVAASRGNGTFAYLIDGADRALTQLPRAYEHNDIQELDRLAFDRMHNRALYRAYDALDDAIARDTRLATYVSEGLDPATAVRAELDGIKELTRDEAIELTKERFRSSKAIVLRLHPSETKKSAEKLALGSQAEERARRVSTEDPRAAHLPATFALPPAPSQMRTKKLSNGLEVVLIPDMSVPSVHVRLAFRAGTGDEPPTKRGVALLAAEALDWNMKYIKDLLLFSTAGGSNIVEVDSDTTTFAVHGTGDQLDYLLAGLRRWVREGIYTDAIDTFLNRVRRERARKDEHAAFAQTWRKALHGADHPYADAGVLSLVDEHLGDTDAAQFRAAHYVPDNATLVISGHFDADLVEQWIDFLFADWTGHAPQRGGNRAMPRATSIGKVEDLTQIELQLALPATSGTRAAQLVLAEMLSELAGDVRWELGASYSVDARLSEQRLATNYLLAGAIDATRAPTALKLLATKVARLRSDPDDAARAFVAARSHVLEELASLGTAEDIASRVERDLSLDRRPLSDLATAAAVRDLTIDQLSPVLADLDLSRALVAMRGPADQLQASFAVLGRTPTYVAADKSVATQDDAAPVEVFVHPFRDTSPREIADPLTARRAGLHFSNLVAAGYSFATVVSDSPTLHLVCSCSGFGAAAEVGAHRAGSIRGGLHFEIANLHGTVNEGRGEADLSFTTIDAGPFAQLRLHDQFWAGLTGGLHTEDETSFHFGEFAEFQLGLDLIPIARHLLGVIAGYQLVFLSGSVHQAATLGVALRQ